MCGTRLVACASSDTVKTRLQTGVDGAGARWATAAMRLLRGLGARTLEMGPLSAAGALGYEWCKRAAALPAAPPP